MSVGHVFNLSLTMAKALNLSLGLDRTFEYECRVINVTVHKEGIGRVFHRYDLKDFHTCQHLAFKICFFFLKN